MYKCKPERNVKQIIVMLLTSVVLTAGAFGLGVYFRVSAVKLLGWGFLVISIYFLYRYSLTEIEYTLDGGNFSITKIVGNKRTEQGVLDLADTVELIPKSEFRQRGLRKEIRTVFNYAQNLTGEHWCYICEFNGSKAVIEFEPNPAFVAIFKDEIDKAKNGDDNGESDDEYDDTHGGLLI